jgi:hypothetical protein
VFQQIGDRGLAAGATSPASPKEGETMRAKIALLVAVLALSVTAATAAPTASAQTTPGLTVTCVTPNCLTQSITGTVNGVPVNLTTTVTRFVNQNGTLAAVVNIVGTVGTQAVNTTTTLPIIGAASSGSCSILDLTLGPLHLNLLGLVVDLNQVHLTITGQTGPGNLLGNLLCGLANALNGGQTGGLAGLLNRLFGL